MLVTERQISFAVNRTTDVLCFYWRRESYLLCGHYVVTLLVKLLFGETGCSVFKENESNSLCVCVLRLGPGHLAVDDEAC
jgi:hypothetical protein